MTIITYRDIIPLRGSINPTERAELENLYNSTNQQLAALAAEATELMHRRRDTIDTALAIRERLWPQRWHHGRRRPEPDANALPPMAPNPVWLHGRALRQICRDILRRNGPQTLVELHAAIHTYGYAINNNTPTKALADAMRYETHTGNAIRLKRGVYATADHPNPEPGEPRLHTEGGPPFTRTVRDILNPTTDTRPDPTRSGSEPNEPNEPTSAQRVGENNTVRANPSDRYRPSAVGGMHNDIVNTEIQHDVARPLHEVARMGRRHVANRRGFGNLGSVVVVEEHARGRPCVLREPRTVEALIGSLTVGAVHHANLGKGRVHDNFARQPRFEPRRFQVARSGTGLLGNSFSKQMTAEIDLNVIAALDTCKRHLRTRRHPIRRVVVSRTGGPRGSCRDKRHRSEA
jgi:hypothetical protein